MKRAQTMFGRVAVVVFAGLALAHALTFAVLLYERGLLARDMMASYLGSEVASALAILDRVPPSERAAWLPRLARRNYDYAIAALPAAAPAGDALSLSLARSVAAAVGEARTGPMLRGSGAEEGAPLLLPLRLADGTMLTLTLRPPALGLSGRAIALLALQVLLLGAATWWGVRVAVRPLGALARAANAIKPGTRAVALKEAGPVEVVHAARAFNDMQRRIDAHLAERHRLLAAISHDLQTPITRMRLRLEPWKDDPCGARLAGDLDAMQALVEEGLAYARAAHAGQEPFRAVDIDALLDGLVCDALDAGAQVALEGQAGAPLKTRMLALRRTLVNLLDNAIKFGGGARVVVARTDTELRIAVRDSGPGIPEAELHKVLEPFYRVESSRNRATGGTGLGLAIASELAAALGGGLRLSNRPEGGLEAMLSLPANPK